MKTIAIVAICLFFVACASGPISAPVAAGGAAMIAVFDQLLAGGALDPAQHHTLVQSVQALEQTVEAVKSNQISPEVAATTAGGLTAAVLGAIRVWRGPSSKGAKPA